MNKVLSEFLNSHAFTYDQKTGFYGKLKGFQVSGNMNSMTGSYCNINVHLSEEAAEKVAEWVETNKKKYGIMNPAYSTNSVHCMINPPFGLTKKYIAFMEDITAFLTDVAAPDCCPFCGEPLEGSDDIRLVGTYGRMFRAHEHCFDEYAEQVTASESMAAKAPNNTLRGLLGAIIGALAGCIVWVLLYFIGYIAVIAAALASLGAAFMWGKFGGKNNKIKIVVIWAVTIVMIMLAMLTAYLIEVQLAINQLVSEGEEISGSAFEWLIILIKDDPELRTEVLIDTLISFVFIVVANVYMTINVLKTQKLESQTLIKY